MTVQATAERRLSFSPRSKLRAVICATDLQAGAGSPNPRCKQKLRPWSPAGRSTLKSVGPVAAVAAAAAKEARESRVARSGKTYRSADAESPDLDVYGIDLDTCAVFARSLARKHPAALTSDVCAASDAQDDGATYCCTPTHGTCSPQASPCSPGKTQKILDESPCVSPCKLDISIESMAYEPLELLADPQDENTPTVRRYSPSSQRLVSASPTRQSATKAAKKSPSHAAGSPLVKSTQSASDCMQSPCRPAARGHTGDTASGAFPDAVSCQGIDGSTGGSTGEGSVGVLFPKGDTGNAVGAVPPRIAPRGPRTASATGSSAASLGHELRGSLARRPPGTSSSPSRSYPQRRQSITKSASPCVGAGPASSGVRAVSSTARPCEAPGLQNVYSNPQALERLRSVGLSPAYLADMMRKNREANKTHCPGDVGGTECPDIDATVEGQGSSVWPRPCKSPGKGMKKTPGKGLGKGPGKGPPPPAGADKSVQPPAKGGKGPGKAPPGKGPPGGKGSAPVGKASAAAEPRKPDVKPGVPVKKLFWSSFRLPCPEDDTVWAAIERDGTDVDTAALEQLFAETSSKSPCKTRGDSCSDDVVKTTKVRKIQVIGSQRRRQLCVMLARLPSIAETCDAIRGADARRLDREQVELLLRNAPTSEDIKIMERAAAEQTIDDANVWDTAEELVLSLMAVPHFKLRLQVWDFENSFQELLAKNSASQKAISLGCDCMLMSQPIRHLLGLVLAAGNYLNGGTPRGRADGFAIDTLSQVRTVKMSQANGADASGPGTLIDYLAQQMEAKYPGKLNLMLIPGGDADMVRNAAREKLEDVAEELTAIQTKVSGLLRSVRSLGLADDEVFSQHGEILSMSMAELEELQNRQSRLEGKYDELSVWFCMKDGSSKKTSSEFFRIMDTFIQEIFQAHEAIQERERKAQKRLERSRSLSQAKFPQSPSRCRSRSASLGPAKGCRRSSVPALALSPAGGDAGRLRKERVEAYVVALDEAFSQAEDSRPSFVATATAGYVSDLVSACVNMTTIARSPQRWRRRLHVNSFHTPPRGRNG